MKQKDRAADSALAYVRLLCSTGVKSTLVVPDLLRTLHDVVPATGYVFTWMDMAGGLAAMYCEPPLDTPVPEFLKDPAYLLAQAGYRNDHLQGQSRNGQVAEISASPEFKSSEFFEVMCRPAGVEHGWDGFVRMDGRVCAVLALWRDAHMARVDAEEEYQLRCVFPHLAHLLAVEKDASDEGAGDRFLPSGEHGLAVVDGTGRIIHASPEAQRMLWYLAHPAFRGHGSPVGDGVPANEAIEEVCRRLCALLRNQPTPAPGLHLRNQWGAFSIRGFILSGHPQAWGDSGATLFGLQVSRCVPPEVAAVRRMMGLPLSHKQRELCLQLVRGLKPAQIEAVLGIKPTTQKDYLLRIYNKLQIASREELFDRLLQTEPAHRVEV
ncbi:helix-turn-helix transcriptional regulator [Sphaerotilus microaerophilus]|uniref:HTH luxR-type domain-containing protein n=1 Tax=Sphaerotilus microaerophilus TaxID=2914710 RepID=A0ABN6PF30_9BURK|nr:hypothetical protein [Sphaerotilus sp. FB-5]BDI03620.1 hypothetical protein CATMQ487_05900 [Sphaerotilus sp. FB-5]